MRDNVFSEDQEVQPRTIKDIAYDRLKRAIIDGRLRPGERLVEDRVAEMLSISRTPLREALIRLVQEGFVDRIANRGAMVAPVTLDEINELSSVRAVLEGLAARAVAQHVTTGRLDGADLEVLHDILRRMCNALRNNDTVAHLRLGRAYHEAIWELAGNKVSRGILQRVVDAMERYRHLVPEPRKMEVIADHARTVEAMGRGDPAAAELLMKEHIEAAGRHYARALEEGNHHGTTESSSRGQEDCQDVCRTESR